MPDTNQESWKFSPLAVLGQSLNFVIANLRLLAVWSVLPLSALLLYVIVNDLIITADISEKVKYSIILAGGILGVWLYVPLAVRIYRKALLGEIPSKHFVNQLFDVLTWRFIWASCKFFLVGAVVLVVLVVLIVLVVLGISRAEPAWFTLAAESKVEYYMRFIGAAIGTLVMDVWLAPRMVVVFSRVSLGGGTTIFGADPMQQIALKARWRIAAVFVLLGMPKEAITLCIKYSWLGLWLEQHPTTSLSMSLLGGLLEFAVWLWALVASANIYSRLRENTEAVSDPAAVPAPGSLGEA